MKCEAMQLGGGGNGKGATAATAASAVAMEKGATAATAASVVAAAAEAATSVMPGSAHFWLTIHIGFLVQGHWTMRAEQERRE